MELKSGGPAMTVTYIGTGGTATCLWFNGNENKTADFNQATLKKKEEPQPQAAQHQKIYTG